MKKPILLILLVNVICLLLPFFITKYMDNDNTIKTEIEAYYDITNSNLVYIDKDLREISISMEEYVKGVVAAEMPALFHEEALKAQAVASRTYALRHIEKNEKNYIENIGQAFLTTEQMQSRWKDSFTEYYNRISLAVDKTINQVIFYNEEPIEAVFHATSGGMTENSEDVWKVELPYLKSVDSSFDENTNDFEETVEIEEEEIKRKFIEIEEGIVFEKFRLIDDFQILRRTASGYVQEIKVGDIIYTGNEFRNIVGIKSTNFTIEEKLGKIAITTKGYGHGAGMSQNGANFMANQGSTYNEIINHYYMGVNIKRID